MQWAMLLLLLTPSALSGAVNQACLASRGAAADVSLHGRLMVYNCGYPNLRLWRVGSHHLFGIYGGAVDLACGEGTPCQAGDAWTRLPGNVQRAFAVTDPFRVKLYADFTVRPLAHFAAGHMQAACIVSAEHLIKTIE